MKRPTLLTCIIGIASVLCCSAAWGDELWLKNGDRLTGKVLSLEGGSLTFKTSYAGDLSIKWDEVTNLKTDDPVRVLLKDETTVQGPLSPGQGGQVSVKGEQGKPAAAIPLASVSSINRKTLKIAARVNVGASVTKGNTDQQNIYADGEFMARTDKNRFAVGALYKRSETDDVKTEDKALGYAKYDRFFTKKWYGYAKATGERDEFKDLDLKTTMGAGAGYQFFESERTNLSLDGGLAYVHENYYIAENRSYAAGAWGLRFDHFIVLKTLQYFLYHTGFQSLEDSEDLTLYTQTGFRIPLFMNLNLTAQMNWDYNNNPSPGKDKSDYTYILSIGYLFAN
jgi:putative salt-induced outer membrane protein YdiY